MAGPGRVGFELMLPHRRVVSDLARVPRCKFNVFVTDQVQRPSRSNTRIDFSNPFSISERHRSSLGNGKSVGLKGAKMPWRQFQDDFVADNVVTIGAIIIVGLTIVFVVIASL